MMMSGQRAVARGVSRRFLGWRRDLRRDLFSAHARKKKKHAPLPAAHRPNDTVVWYFFGQYSPPPVRRMHPVHVCANVCPLVCRIYHAVYCLRGEPIAGVRPVRRRTP